jgi:hypothetical protein
VVSDVESNVVVSPNIEVSDANVSSGKGHVNDQTVQLAREKTFSPASPSGSSDYSHNMSVDLMN